MAFERGKLLFELCDSVALCTKEDVDHDQWRRDWRIECYLCGREISLAATWTTRLARVSHFGFWDRMYAHEICLSDWRLCRWPTFIPERWRQLYVSRAKSAQLLLLLLEAGLPYDIAWPVVALACWLL